MKPNRARLAFAFVLIAVIFVSIPARAQNAGPSRDRLRVVDSTKIQVITMRDGSSLVGRLVSVGADTVEFQTGIGRISIGISDIREITENEVGALHDGAYWFPNPNSTRLFFAPTGQMLKKGEGYFADYEVVFPGFALGLTDNLSIGGGVSILPGVPAQLYYFTPKVGVSLTEKVHVGAGVLLGGVPAGTATSAASPTASGRSETVMAAQRSGSATASPAATLRASQPRWLAENGAWQNASPW